MSTLLLKNGIFTHAASSPVPDTNSSISCSSFVTLSSPVNNRSYPSVLALSLRPAFEAICIKYGKLDISPVTFVLSMVIFMRYPHAPLYHGKSLKTMSLLKPKEPVLPGTGRVRFASIVSPVSLMVPPLSSRESVAL